MPTSPSPSSSIESHPIVLIGKLARKRRIYPVNTLYCFFKAAPELICTMAQPAIVHFDLLRIQRFRILQIGISLFEQLVVHPQQNQHTLSFRIGFDDEPSLVVVSHIQKTCCDSLVHHEWRLGKEQIVFQYGPYLWDFIHSHCSLKAGEQDIYFYSNAPEQSIFTFNFFILNIPSRHNLLISSRTYDYSQTEDGSDRLYPTRRIAGPHTATRTENCLRKTDRQKHKNSGQYHRCKGIGPHPFVIYCHHFAVYFREMLAQRSSEIDSGARKFRRINNDTEDDHPNILAEFLSNKRVS